MNEKTVIRSIKTLGAPNLTGEDIVQFPLHTDRKVKIGKC
jgi:hypothetical protein